MSGAQDRTKYGSQIDDATRRRLLTAADPPLSTTQQWAHLHGEDPSPTAHLFERYRERTADVDAPPVAMAVAAATTDTGLAGHAHFQKSRTNRTACVHVYHDRDDGRRWGLVFPETPEHTIPTCYRLRSVEHGPLRAYLWALADTEGYAPESDGTADQHHHTETTT